LRRRGREAGLPDFIAQVPGSQRRVLVVIEKRSVILDPSPPRADANIRNAGVLRGERTGEHGELANGFERRLARGGLAEYAAVRSLAVEGKTGAVALSPQKFERPIAGALADVGIEIKI